MNTPNIRFKGFGGDWEQRKVGDMTVELSEYIFKKWVNVSK